MTSEPIHARARSQPLPDVARSHPTPRVSMVQPKRPRAPSDPFLDTATPRSIPISSSLSSGNNSTLVADNTDEPITPATANFDGDGDGDELTGLRSDNVFSDPDEEYMRIWTAPDLTNQEYLDLLRVFPSFVTRRPLPRFPAQSSPRGESDLEEGNNERADIRFGTGSMWVGAKPRGSEWAGGWWTRFKMWLKKIFPFC